MTPDMVERARENARKDKYNNVDFRLGEIENLPVADNTADVIISNCVINLSPEKPQVFREAYRTLKPGGRLLVSDLVLLKELPDPIKKSASAYVSCVGGAALKDDYLKAIKRAGFKNVTVVEENALPLTMLVNSSELQGMVAESNISPTELTEMIHSVVSVRVQATK